MAEPGKKLLETVIEDLDTKKSGVHSKTTQKGGKVKKKHKPSADATTVINPTPKRSVTVGVSDKMLDKIKEESDVASEKSVDPTQEEPRIHVTINKILVRTPAVGVENGDIDSDKTEDSYKKTASGEYNVTEMPSRSNTFEREVTFSIRSETPPSSTKRANSRRIKRPKSCRKFTKEDLELFLPRKSYFNSHDKLLIEAGQQVDTHKERKKPNWRAFLNMHTQEELYPTTKEETDDAVQTFKDDDTDSEDELFSMEKTETLVSKEGHRRSRGSSKKDSNPEREKYKPLYEYLKYIHDNPEEYVSITKFTTKNLEHKHPNTLVRLGRVYRRGSSVRNNIYLHAISGLKINIQEQTGTGSSQEETDIMKLRGKAEMWLKTQTTNQFLKAKELALKDVGEEDINYSKWWLAFKSCQYLRLPSHVKLD